ncbi:hypothetical protein [Streptomyces sp. NPDC002185]|uniref:hypothetical protein n=1 Tax=Streptomyces sp. NPDC002185 TaxID=3364636 RepID=UPI0036BCAD94
MPALPELAALQQQPTDHHRAQLLSLALAARAGADAGFAAALEAWHRQAQLIAPGTATGNASTYISGGTQGNVVTTRDVFGGIQLGQPVVPPTGPAAEDRP